MTKITFIDSESNQLTVDAQNGFSVMEVAVQNGVSWIDADCGGACSCATCHGHIDPAFLSKVGKPGEIEKSMLDCEEGVVENSRLCCQIKVTEELDGLRIFAPPV